MRSLSIALVLVLLAACVPARPTPTPAPTPTSWPRTRLASPEYGIQAFLYWNWEAADRALLLIQDMGFKWVKQAVAWRDVEGLEKGQYDWVRTDRMVKAVRRSKLNLILRIDHQPFWAQAPGSEPLENAPPVNLQDFGDFCHALAEHYAGKVSAYRYGMSLTLRANGADSSPTQRNT